MQRVKRPLWRSYDVRWRDNAVAHVRAGGHAMVRNEARWTLLFPLDDGMLGELSAWALLDLGIRGFKEDVPGVALAKLPDRFRERVEAWCERDGASPVSVARERYDCRACAACCRHNRVVLDDADDERWGEAGRGELSEAPYVRTVRTRRVLTVLRGGDCVHLRGNDCAIYDLRPDNCRAFPAGSEGCLAAREERKQG